MPRVTLSLEDVRLVVLALRRQPLDTVLEARATMLAEDLEGDWARGRL